MERWVQEAAFVLLISSLLAPMVARLCANDALALLLECITRLCWGAGCLAMGVYGDHFAWENWATRMPEFPVSLLAGRATFLLFGLFLIGTGVWLLLHPEKRHVLSDDDGPS